MELYESVVQNYPELHRMSNIQQVTYSHSLMHVSGLEKVTLRMQKCIVCTEIC